jgi:hypothetical protein
VNGHAHRFLMALRRSLEVAFLEHVQLRFTYRRKLVDEVVAAEQIERGRAVLVLAYNAAGSRIGAMRVGGRA